MGRAVTLMLFFGLVGCGDTSAPVDVPAQDGGDLDVSRVDAAPAGDAASDYGTAAVDGGVEPDSRIEGDMLPPERAVEGLWAPRAAIESGAIQEIAVVALHGEVYVLGGFDGFGRIVATMSIYNPATDQWRRGPELPTPMHHANAAAVNGQIYILGALKQDFEEDGRGYIYDPETARWRDGPALPAGTARGASGVAVLGEEIVLIGGLGGRRAVSLVSAYHVGEERWRRLPDLPAPARDHMAVGTVDGQIIVAGGRDGRIHRHVPAVHIFDPDQGSWRAGAPMPTSRGGAAAAVCGETLYVMGGEGNAGVGTGVFDQVEAYRLGADRWDVLPPMSTPRHGNGAVAIRDWIYVPGGADVQAFGAVPVHERMGCDPGPAP